MVLIDDSPNERGHRPARLEDFDALSDLFALFKVRNISMVALPIQYIQGTGHVSNRDIFRGSGGFEGERRVRGKPESNLLCEP